MGPDTKRTPAEKLAIFRSLFRGLEHVYGTYDFRTRRAYQVKAPVTDRVIHNHLAGKQPYGVYPLKKGRTWLVVLDFDDDDANPPLRFVAAASHYGLSAYIERSKSKGFHAWMFFVEEGVIAAKARLVVQHVLKEIGEPNTEVFPKQDALDERNQYGNFINAPLFGRLVRQGRTVFLDPKAGLQPYPNQWDFLESVQRVSEHTLDEVIEVNGLNEAVGVARDGVPEEKAGARERSFGLPPCAQRMLEEGVSAYQRVACFRLAVGLKKAGLPLDAAIATLNVWALKNRPVNGKAIISRKEVMDQVTAAYRKGYRSCGCNDPAVQPYCDPNCPLRRRHQAGALSAKSHAKGVRNDD